MDETLISTEPLGPAPERLAAALAASPRPYVTLKAAATLDGRLATRHGESQWITGEVARAHAMRLRAGHEAVLVGRGTAQADDPRLTVRLTGVRARPARVVLDSLARIAPQARLLADDGARRIVVAGCDAPPECVAALTARGVQVLRCATPRPQPAEYLARLREAGLRSVLVEGGAQVHSALIAQDMADELFLYLGGRVLGDREAPAWCGELAVARLADAPRVRLDAPQALAGDVLLHGWFDGPPRQGTSAGSPGTGDGA
jgi:diaminohydroxyphosphoribosylaminopyrimidine deaminase/5-amino-6-(5-phosphoribosylamino)uracil reductase